MDISQSDAYVKLLKEAEECERQALEDKINANMGTHGLVKVTRVTLQPSELNPAFIDLCEELVDQSRHIEGLNAKIKAAIDARREKVSS